MPYNRYSAMQLDCDEIGRVFPWLKELWLFEAEPPRHRSSYTTDVLAVSSVPPRQVAAGQRRRLLTQLEGGSDRPLALRLTSSGQLARWLARPGRFAATFRRGAVKVFERP